MKRILFPLLAILIILSCTSCVVVEYSDDESKISNDSKEPNSSGESSTKEEIIFSELVVVDNSECTIKIVGIDPDNFWGYTLNVYLENKSVDKTYMYSVETLSVNGVEADPMFATEVAAGKKANKEINLPSESLKEKGIDLFTDIQISFRVYDTNNWEANNVAQETIHVYPYGEEKATVFVREQQSSDTVLVDNEYVTVIVINYETDDIWGYTANLFIVNKTDKEIMVSTDEVSVNGFMIDPYFGSTLYPNTCKFTSISWDTTTLTQNNITTVEEIEFLLRVYNYEEIFDSDYVNERIKLTP